MPVNESTYIEAASALIGLEIAPGHREAVEADLRRIASIAEFLMAFPLAQNVEPAPVFRP